ncbi:MAG: hydrogenase/urease maturation nickel metallochaperone HypA [Candidatus Eisenbacteria bacterium]|nr:hydrogenase/urease maturation nickel metallochaperone HypA [Candidatus Eisenbacteria bacterium]
MHEWKIAEAVLEEIIAQSEKHKIKKIKKVTLSIGEDADHTGEQIEFCLKALAKDKALESLPITMTRRQGKGGITVESIEGEK